MGIQSSGKFEPVRGRGVDKVESKIALLKIGVVFLFLKLQNGKRLYSRRNEDHPRILNEDINARAVGETTE